MEEIFTIAEGRDSSPQGAGLEATAFDASSVAEDTTPADRDANSSGIDAKFSESTLPELADGTGEGVESTQADSGETEESGADESAKDGADESCESEKSDLIESDDEPSKSPENISDEAEKSEVTVPIRFNHQRRELTLKEAAEYAQKGLAAEPIMAKLRFLAQTQNKNVGQVVDDYITNNEQSRYKEICEIAGGDMDIINQLLVAQARKDRKAFDEMVAAQQTEHQQEVDFENNRLADGFIQLQNEFPNIADISQIPDQVINNAVDFNISLMDAYLRFLHSENRRVAQAKAAEELAARAAVGSQKSRGGNHASAEIEAMMQGIWG